MLRELERRALEGTRGVPMSPACPAVTAPGTVALSNSVCKTYSISGRQALVEVTDATAPTARALPVTGLGWAWHRVLF